MSKEQDKQLAEAFGHTTNKLAGKTANEILDTVLETFLKAKEKNHRLSHSDFIDILLLPEITMVLEKLVEDGFVRPEDSPHAQNKRLFFNAYCILTFNGKYFIENGGYRKKEVEENNVHRLKLKQIRSTIETNISVKATNKIQKKILWLSLATSLAAVVVSVINLYLQKPIIVNPAPVVIQRMQESQSKDTIQPLPRKHQLGHN